MSEFIVSNKYMETIWTDEQTADICATLCQKSEIDSMKFCSLTLNSNNRDSYTSYSFIVNCSQIPQKF